METDNPFEKVLDRLREKGWCKGALGGEDGPNCLLGADLQIVGMAWVERTIMVDIIQNEYPERLRTNAHISTFNNHHNTTFSDVERVLEKAAIQWEEERVLRND